MEDNGSIVIYESEGGDVRLDVRLENGTVWLTQVQMSLLYGKAVSTINEHIGDIFADEELSPDVCRKKFGNSEFQQKAPFYYNLDLIIAVGFRVRSRNGVIFRKWAGERLNEYIVKGFTMDDERLKEMGGGGYWKELLNRIRDIRASEKVFYRQVLDIYATSVDYNPKAEISIDFFKKVQNKIHYAVHGQTAGKQNKELKESMKKAFYWILVVALACSVGVFSACTKADGPDNAGKKALLIILDGWGIGDKGKDDVISQTATPYIDNLMASYPHSQLQASGEYVGLPDGQMGNSETGHLNIGAGRVVYQDLVRINRACADNSILKNPEIKAAYSYAKSSGNNLHLMGLTSTGGVHSSLGHLLKLIDIAKEYNISNCYVHCFMDGRDTDPRAGKGFIADVQQHIDEVGTGAIATVIGRYYAMDRDQHWDRIKLAYDLIVSGKGRVVTDMVAGVQSCYDTHTEEHKNTDEFMEPLVNSTVDGRIREGDVVIFFNFRSDRARELTTVLTQQDMPEQGMTTIPNLQYYCMTPYDDSFTGVHVIFQKDNLNNTLGEYISSKGLKQLHIAETEKYAHVTSFINGGREEPFPGEDRILVTSPAVATYDLKPEMSAFEVKDKLVEALKTKQYDWVVVNFANADMVGHTGVYSAIGSAVKVIDDCLNEVVETAKKMGYETIITADHGNADHALNDDGTPNTTHSTNPVPFICVTEKKNATVRDGVLADVAPSILHIIGLEQPVEMTGKCLIND